MKATQNTIPIYASLAIGVAIIAVDITVDSFFLLAAPDHQKLDLLNIASFEQAYLHLFFSFTTLALAWGGAALLTNRTKVKLIFWSWPVAGYTLLGLLFPVLCLLFMQIFTTDLNFIRQPPGEVPLWLLALFMLMISGGEELMCRFLPLAAGNKIVVYLLFSLLFTFLHAFNASFDIVFMLNVLLFSLTLSALTWLSRSILPAIVFHFLWNFINGPLLGLPVSGIQTTGIVRTTFEFKYNLYHNPAIGLESAITCTLALGFLLIPLAVMVYRRSSRVG